MRPDIDTPPEPSHSVVHDAHAQMTFRFERISCLCTWGGSARTLPLGNRIRSMVNVCHGSEGVVACCGYFWRDRDAETD